MNPKHVAHIILFVLTLFVTVPALCNTAFADMLSIETVQDNAGDPQSLEADDLTHTAHIYISLPEPSAASTVKGNRGLVPAARPLWWRPPMESLADNI